MKEKLKPFRKLPLLNFFQYDLEKIHMAYRLSDTIRGDVGNIRAAGDQVELAIRNFYKKKLEPKYYVGDGHIVDRTLKVSPQYDLIICENSKNPVLFSLADKSDLLFFEPVYCFAEIKKSLYQDDLLSKFSENISRFKRELVRDFIPNNYIETGNTGIRVDQKLTSLPLRNPILSFLFFVSSSDLRIPKLKTYLQNTDNEYLPNFIVFLDQGIVVNVSTQNLERGRITINLYPEFENNDTEWILLDLGGDNNVLLYQYLLVVQHLNSTVVSSPSMTKYTEQLFNIDLSNIIRL